MRIDTSNPAFLKEIREIEQAVKQFEAERAAYRGELNRLRELIARVEFSSGTNNRECPWCGYYESHSEDCDAFSGVGEV